MLVVLTTESITTHGKFKDDTISSAKDVFPDPELPAIPIMLVSALSGILESALTYSIEWNVLAQVDEKEDRRASWKMHKRYMRL